MFHPLPTRARSRRLHFSAAVALVTFAHVLGSCRSVVDPGITYRECDRSGVSEEFPAGTTSEELGERCWEVGNDDGNLLLDDGDLILRLNELSGQPQRWASGTQGPMVFQRFEGDFVMAARLEVLHKRDGSLCLPPDNEVGLVLRQTAPDLAWTTLLISPFDVEEPCVPTDDAAFPIQAKTRSSESSWGPDVVFRGPEDGGIAFLDGETDLAVCRVEGQVTFYYREPASPVTDAQWLPIGAPIATGNETLDVGPTASGGEERVVEGHFTWVGYAERDVGDGCTGLLQLLDLPEVE